MSDPFANPHELVRRVYAYAVYRLRNELDAEDVTSETFARAFQYRESFDARRGDPAAWLIGIARNCIADAAQKRELPTDEAIDHAVDGHEDDALRRIEMRAAVAQLDERDRELVALRYGADLTAKQIGELLDMRTNAVEVALHRALARLRSIIEGDEHELNGTKELQWTPRPQD